jgi:hypothetical protein
VRFPDGHWLASALNRLGPTIKSSTMSALRAILAARQYIGPKIATGDHGSSGSAIPGVDVGVTAASTVTARRAGSGTGTFWASWEAETPRWCPGHPGMRRGSALSVRVPGFRHGCDTNLAPRHAPQPSGKVTPSAHDQGGPEQLQGSLVVGDVLVIVHPAAAAITALCIPQTQRSSPTGVTAQPDGSPRHVTRRGSRPRPRLTTYGNSSVIIDV